MWRGLVLVLLVVLLAPAPAQAAASCCGPDACSCSTPCGESMASCECSVVPSPAALAAGRGGLEAALALPTVSTSPAALTAFASAVSTRVSGRLPGAPEVPPPRSA